MQKLDKWLIGLVLVAGVLIAVTPVSAQQINFPNDGNGLLDYCGQMINSLDNPPSSFVTPTTWLKRGWCVGHLQTMREMILVMNARVVQTVASVTDGHKPSAEELKYVISASSDMTCIPSEAGMGQLARVLVKWLRDNPARLNETPGLLAIDAFHDSFPCKKGDTTTKKPTAD